MADGGGFFGGLSSGIGDAQAQALAQQKQDALEATQTKVLANNQLNTTVQYIRDLIKATSDAGHDPNDPKVKAAIAPYAQSAQDLAVRAGLPNDYVPKLVTALLTRPPLEDASKKPVSIGAGGALYDPNSNKVLYSRDVFGNENTPGATPAPIGPVSNTNLTAPGNTITGMSVTPLPNNPPSVQTAAVSPTSAVDVTAPDTSSPPLTPAMQSAVKTGIIDQQTLDFKARQYNLIGNQALTGYSGRGTAGQAIKAVIQARAAQLATGEGMSPADVTAQQANTAAARSTLTKLVNAKNAIEQYERTAVANGDVLVGLAQKVDKTGSPVLERWLRAGRQSIAGDTDVSNFNTQLALWRAEIAKILVNPNLTGVLTDNARHEIASAIQDGASYAQIKEANDLLKGDFQRRSRAVDEQIQSVTNSFGRKARTDVTVPGPSTIDALKTKYNLQ